MKRIMTLALLLITATLGTWAEVPFTVTTADLPLSTNWYTIKVGGSGYLVKGNTEKITLTSGGVTYADEELWAFVGNDTDGYTLYNKAFPGYVLAASTTMSGTTGGGTYVHLVKADEASDDICTLWQFAASSDLGSDINAQYMYEKGLTSYKVNNRDGNLAFWTGGADSGSSLDIAWAQKTFEVNRNTGAWSASNSAGTWHSAWTSTDDVPSTVQVTTAGSNNMKYTEDFITGYGGVSQSSEYRFTTGAKYIVSGVEFDLTFLDGASSTMTLTVGDTAYTGKDEAQHVVITDGKEQTYTTVLSGGNQGITFENLFITIRPSAEIPEWSYLVFDNSGAVPYRIPAIATTQKGTIVAVADYRFCKADIGNGRIDLRVRTSSDNGQTWGEIIKPACMTGDGNMTNNNQNAGYGDPCIIADRESNKILLVSCSGYPGFFSGTRENHMGWARWYSEDEGQTWTGPDLIDEDYIYAPFDSSTYGAVKGWFVGSGKIHQSRYTKVGDYYRLYLAGSTYNGTQTANWVLYSDDFGMTWGFVGGCNKSPIPGGDEPKIEELPNGKIVLSSRCTSGRNFNIFTFTDVENVKGAWSTVALSSSANNGVTANNGCNGEILVLPVKNRTTGDATWVALQSLPRGSGRTNVSVFYKGLTTSTKYNTPSNFAKNWDGYRTVSKVSSAYSTMTLQNDKSIGFLYEENGGNGGYDIVYKNYSVEQLTDSIYTYNYDYDPATPIALFGSVMENNDEALTVLFNKPVTLNATTVELADGVSATAELQEDLKTVILTYTEKLAPAKYTLTIPEGFAKDDEGFESPEISTTFRVLTTDIQSLGDTITTLENVCSDKTYILYNPHFTTKAIYAPQYSETMLWAGETTGDSSHAVSNTNYTDAVNPADPNNSWMLLQEDDKCFLYNVGLEKFLVVGSNSGVRNCSFSKCCEITVKEVTDGFAFSTTGNTNDWMCVSPQLTYPVSVWTASDSGSTWQLIENPNVVAEYDRALEIISGINSTTVTPCTAKQGIYTIDGRQLQAMPTRRGLYIVNGKKVLR